MSGTSEIDEDKQIQEEYKVWKKNSPFLYDLVMSHALEWPSLTCQWFGETVTDEERNVNIHKLILGTHTSGNEPNYLMIADILLPSPDEEIDCRKYNDEKKEVGGFGCLLNKIDIKITIDHFGDVHKARAMPQNNFLIATKSSENDTYVFDYSKHGSVPDGNFNPQHTCRGHTSDGYGLAWSPISSGLLLSGSNDNTVCLWDIANAGANVDPLLKLTSHTDFVGDVDWSKRQDKVFGSVGDDSMILLWDMRDHSNRPFKKVTNAHNATNVNTISFNAVNDYYIATGGSDNTVRLWDIRNMDKSIHTFEGHTDGIFNVEWSPFNETILASSGEDRRIFFWDISKIGLEQTPEDAEDGPPEILFQHGGHTSKISDFSWNANEPWVVAGVAEDNILQVWKMAESIYIEEDDDEDEIDDTDIEDQDLEKPEIKKQKNSN